MRAAKRGSSGGRACSNTPSGTRPDQEGLDHDPDLQREDRDAEQDQHLLRLDLPPSPSQPLWGLNRFQSIAQAGITSITVCGHRRRTRSADCGATDRTS